MLALTASSPGSFRDSTLPGNLTKRTSGRHTEIFARFLPNPIEKFPQFRLHLNFNFSSRVPLRGTPGGPESFALPPSSPPHPQGGSACPDQACKQARLCPRREDIGPPGLPQVYGRKLKKLEIRDYFSFWFASLLALLVLQAEAYLGTRSP